MANIDYAGLLTGISGQNQQIDPFSLPSAAQQRMAFGAQQAQGMQRAGEGLFGMPSQQNPVDMAKTELLKLDRNDPEYQQKFIKLLGIADPAKAAELRQELIKKQAEQQLRNNAIASAKALGLTATVESLQSGGSVTEAQKTIYKEQERQMVTRGGRRGKVAVAKAKNASPEIIARIEAGDFDEMSDELFINQLEGKKATIKAFRGEDGVIRSRRVDEQGNVYNDKTGKWESPLSLGLSPAPVVTQQLSAADSITQQLTGQMTGKFLELHEQAGVAQKILKINADSMDVLDKGIVSGFTAPLQLEILRIGKALDILPQDLEDKVAATELFMISRAKQVLPLIKALGSGTAISDKDREFIEKVVAGDVSLDADTIREVVRIENVYAMDAIEKNNTALDTLNKIQGSSLDPSMYESFYIQQPEQSLTQKRYSTGAESYLNRIKGGN
jgi:hypothetical protein